MSEESSWAHTFASMQQDIGRYPHERRNILVLAARVVYAHPSSAGVLYYRLSRQLWLSRKNPLAFSLLLVCRAIYPLVRLYSGLELLPQTQIGPGLCVLHFGPTVIHPDVRAGANLTLLHGVTLGLGKTGAPVIGDNVKIGTGASVIGKIVIGHGARVGAGAVVTRDVPDGCTVVGIPARPTMDPEARE